MTIVELGAIGEFIAALAVLITLIYLALQVRENTRSIRMATFESAVRGVQDHHRTLITDPELLRVHFAGQKSLDELGPEDRLRFHGLMLNLLLEYQLFLRSFDEGTQSRKEFAGRSLSEFEKLVLSLLRTPGGTAWWKGETYLNSDFRETVDGLLEAHPEIRFAEGDTYIADCESEPESLSRGPNTAPVDTGTAS